MALSGATTPGQSGPGSDGNEGVLCIPQSPSITGTSSSDCLVSLPGHSLGGVLTPLQRCSRCILQSQPTGQRDFGDAIYIYIYIYIYIVQHQGKMSCKMRNMVLISIKTNRNISVNDSMCPVDFKIPWIGFFFVYYFLFQFYGNNYHLYY